VWLRLNHITGTKKEGYVTVGDSATDCNGAGISYRAPFVLSPTLASDSAYHLTVPFRAIFVPSTRGPVTYYLNGLILVGQNSSDVFWYSNMAAHVY
jgi:hypothetical protein